MNVQRATALTLALWMTAVVAALALTLSSLRDGEYDGLNYLLQLPLALPWVLLVPASTDHTTQAWIDAGWGALNGVLLAVLVGAIVSRRATAARRAR